MTDRAVRWLGRSGTVVLLGLALTATAAGPARADAIRDRQWHLAALHASEAHAVNQGEGVTVAVVDSGVAAGHPDLEGNVLPGVDLTGTTPDGRTDTHGHGTSMASDIAAHGHGPDGRDGVLGLAPRASILPVRVSTDGRGGDVGAGIRWAADHGARIINVSSVSPDLSTVREATSYALDKGAVLVAGTGNDGTSGVGAPAMYPGVVAVGGLDRTGALWARSSRGPETVITAPAVDIVSTDPGGRYAIANGTSDATALVSATVALIWSRYPQLDAHNVIHRLVATADHRGESGRNGSYGFGAVNPYRALTESVQAVAVSPLAAPTSAPLTGAPPVEAVTAARPAGGPVRVLAALAGGGALLLALGTVVAVRRRRR
ncbi:hypothetical protein Lfu02_36810 [Longispora fulva]|uniref:Type VII secretion-associated serine protease mycosin n=1 Tax=Longispora fulva TaxID=619741 RepID=A0A8J7GYD1_9ACTN|nr:S8 family serine peptidase [Longispora fulva]MBG6141539.1 type VII secretion-associated serine protease mycosin [Longispora fulva]GIG59309.1 hypothetical protein Lfu02_36810 [Longispora fulva]